MRPPGADTLGQVSDGRAREPYAVVDGAQRARRGRVAVTPYALRLASELWQTSSVLLVSGSESVAIDPGVTQREIEAVRARAEAEEAPVVAVIATHGDFDHIAGIASFPEAEAVMGPRAAARIASGDALREMAEEGAPLGLSWPGSPRCDRVLQVGRCARDRAVRDRDDGARGPHRRRHRPPAPHARRPDRRRLPLPDRVPVRLPLDGCLPQHPRRPGRHACAATLPRS